MVTYFSKLLKSDPYFYNGLERRIIFTKVNTALHKVTKVEYLVKYKLTKLVN